MSYNESLKQSGLTVLDHSPDFSTRIENDE
ncbi:MAG: hypothetical protein ACI96M_004483 [Candidatus Azotimanducaceae bacterium]